MTLIPNQPYPDLTAWEDLAPVLRNGWATPTTNHFLAGVAMDNLVSLSGRIQIGTHHVIANLPDTYHAFRPFPLQALIFGGPPCIIELQGSSVAGGWQMVMSSFALGMTNAEMIEKYSGMQLSFSTIYPRKAM